MKKRITTYLMIPLLFLGVSCDTCDIIAAADLAIRALIKPANISIGRVMNFVAELTNVREEGNQNCNIQTREAGQTLYLWALFKKNKDTNEWEEYGGDEEFQQSIKADEDIGQIIPVTVLDPGTYRLDALTDSPDRVEERDENNNDRKTEFSSLHNITPATPFSFTSGQMTYEPETSFSYFDWSAFTYIRFKTHTLKGADRMKKLLAHRGTNNTIHIEFIVEDQASKMAEIADK
ncbi:MAG: hypothetical protein AAFR87_35635 [Bacteroidota bacterium]